MGYKMIIVEDERIVREGLVRFEWETIQVDIVASFNNAISALEYLRDNAVDIVLTDIRMPMMDGMEFIRCMRKEFPSVSIVCLSGYSDYEYLRECIQQGVKDYILKPADKQELFQVISRLTEPLAKDRETSPRRYEIEKALEYVEQNYQRPIKLANIAESVYLNPVYFSHVFKQEMGVRFVDYLVEYRIQKAIELMKNPELTISAIAVSVGFFSSRYFAEIFKRRKGMTPKEYRRRQHMKGKEDKEYGNMGE